MRVLSYPLAAIVMSRLLSAVLIVLPVLLSSGPAPAQSVPAVPVTPVQETAGAATPGDTSGDASGLPHDPALFEGQSQVSGQSEAERRGAISRALVQVLVRLSGDRAAPLSPLVRKALGNAEGLVTHADYHDELAADTTGVPSRQVLQVQFDPSGIEALMVASGLHYWPVERPQPLLWLVIDDGRGPRLVTDKQLAVVRPLAQRGLERGLRFGLPAGTSVEQAAVQSLWAQNADAIAPLSGRYQRDAQLLGKLYRAEGGWRAEWLLTQSGAELGRWTVNEVDPQRAIAEGADGAADALAKRDAIALDSGPAGARTVLVTGIESANDFTRVMGYLQNLAVVRRADVLEAAAGQLRLRLDLAVGRRSFDALLGSGSTLAATGQDDDGVAGYRLKP